jgi:hypothetical protein
MLPVKWIWTNLIISNKKYSPKKNLIFKKKSMRIRINKTWTITQSESNMLYFENRLWMLNNRQVCVSKPKILNKLLNFSNIFYSSFILNQNQTNKIFWWIKNWRLMLSIIWPNAIWIWINLNRQLVMPNSYS